MILRKDEKDGLIECLYKSSNVILSKYKKTGGVLTLIFKEGRSYSYEGVTLTDYTRFEISDSQGSAISKYIKKYKTTRNSDVVIQPLLEEIEKFSNKEVL